MEIQQQKTVPRQFFERIYGSESQLESQSVFYNNTSEGLQRSDFNMEYVHKSHPINSYSHLSGFASFLARRKRKEGRPRRQRTTFSGPQTLKLEMEFNQNEYISRSRRFELADILNLSESQIKIWFQNRRAKDKRIEKAQIDQQYRLLVTKFLPGSVTGNCAAHNDGGNSYLSKPNINHSFIY